VESDFAGLADPPTARPLNLTCYPFGSTAAGSPVPGYSSGPFPVAPMMMDAEGAIVVTAQRREMAMMDAASPISVLGGNVLAAEENLGDLKLYRVPDLVTVAAQSLKQVAFLRREGVEGRLLYTAGCDPHFASDTPLAAGMLLETVNDEDHGLGAALPTGQLALFEGGMLVGEQTIRDYASGQDVELALGESTQVFARCIRTSTHELKVPRWHAMRATLTNATPAPVVVRLSLGSAQSWQVRRERTRLKDGERIVELTIPANGTRDVTWDVLPASL
jgi:hypothetical protein